MYFTLSVWFVVEMLWLLHFRSEHEYLKHIYGYGGVLDDLMSNMKLLKTHQICL